MQSYASMSTNQFHYSSLHVYPLYHITGRRKASNSTIFINKEKVINKVKELTNHINLVFSLVTTLKLVVVILIGTPIESIELLDIIYLFLFYFLYVVINKEKYYHKEGM